MGCFLEKLWKAGGKILLVFLLLGGNGALVMAQGGTMSEVWISGTDGDDRRGGTDQSDAVATFARAKSLLIPGGTIMVAGELTVGTDETWDLAGATLKRAAGSFILIRVEKGATLILSNIVIDGGARRNPDDGQYSGVDGKDYALYIAGKVVMNDGCVIQNHYSTGSLYNTGAVSTSFLEGGELEMNAGSSIRDNNFRNSSIGGGVTVCQKGKFTMNGGEIVRNGSGGVGNSGTFIMNGGLIAGNNVVGMSGGGVYNCAVFEMLGGKIAENVVNDPSDNDGGGGVANKEMGGVPEKVIFRMKGGEISGNKVLGEGKLGGGVFVYDNAVFEMEGGVIKENMAYYGGGVHCEAWGSASASFVMKGGHIQGNKAVSTEAGQTWGGGIYVGNNTVFKIIGSPDGSNDPVISGNVAEVGGGMANNGGTILMQGGVVEQNSAKMGAGIFCFSEVMISGGEIRDNQAVSSGGGLEVYKNGTSLVGGIIRNNTAGMLGGNIRMRENVSVGGKIQVPGGIYINEGKKFLITSSLQGVLGVSAIGSSVPAEGTVVAEGDGYVATDTDARKFSYSENQFGCVLSDTRQVVLGKPLLVKIETEGLATITFKLAASAPAAEFQIVGAESQTVTNVPSRGKEYTVAPAADGMVCIYGADASKLTQFFINGMSKGITALDVSGGSGLQMVNSSENRDLKTLRMPAASAALINLSCYSCTSLTALDLSGCRNLESLTCNNDSALVSLILPVEKSKLSTVGCVGLACETLDFSEYTALKKLTCGKHKELTEIRIPANLGELSISDCPKLRALDFSGSNLYDLTCSRNPVLSSLTLPAGIQKLTCSLCDFQNLDMSAYSELITLIADNNPLTRLVLPQEPTRLQVLQVAMTKLEKLDVTPYLNLYRLECGSCPSLMDLKLPEVKSGLGKLYIQESLFTELDLKGYTKLDEVQGVGCSVAEFDVTGCTKLKNVFLDKSQVQRVVAAGCAILNWLHVYDCPELTSVDVSGCAEAKVLWCFNSPWLTSLKVEGCSKLTNLRCDNCALAELNIAGCTSLSTLFECQNNRFTPDRLPRPTADLGEKYKYAPQAPLAVVRRVPAATGIDLGTWAAMTAPGAQESTPTEFVWRKTDGTLLVKGVDYMESDSHFTFLTAVSDSVYCELTNAAYPDFKEGQALRTIMTRIEGNLTVDTTRQKFTYNTLGHAFEVKPSVAGLTGFSVTYRVAGSSDSWNAAVPVQAGDWDVCIQFPASDLYAALDVTVPAGLRIGQAEVVLTLPVAGLIARGAALSTLPLVGGTAVRSGSGDEVAGKFRWTDSTQVVTADGTFGVTFTPDDIKNYHPVTGNIAVTVGFPVAVTVPEHGTLVASPLFCAPGMEVKLTAVPARGYALASLFWNENELESGDSTFIMPGAPVEVKAVFAATDYTITYHLGGGTNYAGAPGSYTVESPDIILGTPARDGYNFAGWWDAAEGGTSVTSIASGSMGNVALYARWIPIVYTISYHLDGGTNYAGAPGSYTVESSDIILGVPTREGYAFAGWWDAAEDGASVTAVASGSIGNIVLYARWTVVPCYEITYGQADHGQIEIMSEGLPVASGVKLRKGSRVTIAAVPDLNHRLVSLTVNGRPFESGNEYTLEENITVEAVFALIENLPEARVINAVEVRGDNNTLLRILGRQRYTSVRLKLFNVQGKLVYSHNNYLEDECDLRDYPRGAYYYVIEAVNVNGGRETLKGGLEVIR